MKRIIFVFISVFLTTTFTTAIAQTPAYVPKNGLIGWWPFNGNAKDESGNGNNGTVSGATLSVDKFGKTNSAYHFDGSNDYIDLNNLDDLNGLEEFTFNGWVKYEQNTYNVVFSHWISGANPNGDIGIYINIDQNRHIDIAMEGGYGIVGSLQLDTGIWSMITVVYNGAEASNAEKLKVYVNGQEDVLNFNSRNVPDKIGSQANTTLIGARGVSWGIDGYSTGTIDDIALWSRIIDKCEIFDLYHSQLNSGRVKLSSNGINTIGADFIVTASDTAKLSYQWQTDVAGLGWIDLKDNTVYQGSSSPKLTVNNLALANHNQLLRVVTTGTCMDTSEGTAIVLADTCITHVTDTVVVKTYDTIRVSVTDTLIINVNYTSIGNQPKYNAIKVYPNPSSSEVVIDYGNYAVLNGFTTIIYSASGVPVYNQLITQNKVVIDLSTIGKKGVYFLHIVDKNNTIVESRKIILQ